MNTEKKVVENGLSQEVSRSRSSEDNGEKVSRRSEGRKSKEAKRK